MIRAPSVLVAGLVLGLVPGICIGGGCFSPTVSRADAWGWAPAQPLEVDTSAEDHNPVVGLNGTGDGIVVWQRGDSIWTRPYRATSDVWGPPSQIAPVSRRGDLQVGIDDQGNTLALWSRDDAEPSRGIWWSRSADRGKSWSAPAQLSNGKDYQPALAVGPDGTALAAWTEHQADNLFTVISADLRGGVWSASLNSPRAGTDSADRNPGVAVDGRGRGFLIWEQPAVPNGVDSVWTERYDGSWLASSVATLEAYDADDSDTPSIALNENGAGTALWVQINAYAPEIWARHYDGSGWSAPELVGAGFLIEWDPPPRIAVDPSGSSVAIWSQILDRRYYNVRAARHRAGQTAWELPQAIETDNLIGDDLTEYAQPQVGMDADGNAIAAWRKQTASGRVLAYTSRLPAGDSVWTPPGGMALQDDGINGVLTTDFAVSRGGTALRAWCTTSDFNIWTRQYRSLPR